MEKASIRTQFIDPSQFDLKTNPDALKVYNQSDPRYLDFALRIDHPFIVKLSEYDRLFGKIGDFLVQHNPGKLETDPLELDSTTNMFSVFSVDEFIAAYKPWSPDPEEIKDSFEMTKHDGRALPFLRKDQATK